MHVGETLRYYRLQENLTQQQVADQLFISDRAYGHYETGKRTPSIDILKQLSHILKVEFESFFKEEPKRLLQLQYTYEEFKKMLDKQSYDGLRPIEFIVFLESDRYFVQLNRKYRGSLMTFLVWLLDGFYLIPLKSDWCDGYEKWYTDHDNMKKVSKSDVDYIQKSCGKRYIKCSTEQSFAESFYSSYFEKLDFTISDEKEIDVDLHSFMIYETEGFFAFDYEKECFYIKSEEGIIKVYFRDAEYDEQNFLVIDCFQMDERVLLSQKDIDELEQYVSLKEKECQLLFHELEHTESLQAKKKISESYRKQVAFVDKMKQILEPRELLHFSFLPNEEEVEIEREIEVKRKKEQEIEEKIKKEETRIANMDTSKRNKVLFLHNFFVYAFDNYTKMIEDAGYQVIKNVCVKDYSRIEGYIQEFSALLHTEYEPDIIFLKRGHADTETIKEIRKISKTVKIVTLSSLTSEHYVRSVIGAGANHIIRKESFTEKHVKEIFDSVMSRDDNSN